jgi:hypothetical protein
MVDSSKHSTPAREARVTEDYAVVLMSFWLYFCNCLLEVLQGDTLHLIRRLLSLNTQVQVHVS